MRPLAILAALAGTPALATCPTAADMTGGVVFTLQGGGTELHKVIRKDWVQIRATFPDGDASQLELFHGLYLSASVAIANGIPQLSEAFTYATETELQQWQPPRPDGAWDNATAGGGTAKSGPIQPVQLGDCVYNSFDVVLTYTNDEGYVETYRYLPALRTGLLVAAKDESGTQNYTYTDLRVSQ
ncbi:hypothetical protein AIOL_003827 [Candidatus Rhodobacter oscarellae]|uniref:Uncharacterized protein n=2 Tax=Candidatus Rhodobacter oscarellae TaxID=1675527 RepID=A0A0J9E7Y5_9RHOB|nr:hypothetical protein AIOL_003827 [Candidatus Rhodobacter lobularis]